MSGQKCSSNQGIKYGYYYRDIAGFQKVVMKQTNTLTHGQTYAECFFFVENKIMTSLVDQEQWYQEMWALQVHLHHADKGKTHSYK